MLRIILITSALLFLITACSSFEGEHIQEFDLTTTVEDRFPLTQTKNSLTETFSTPTTQATTFVSATAAVTPTNEILVTVEPTAAPILTLTLPDPGAYSWITVIADLRAPVGLSYPIDGSNRLFIIEQDGRILSWNRDSYLSQLYLDITDRVGSEGSEQGLLGLAFHPQYEENGFFYVNYTDRQGVTVVSRFNVSMENPNSADPASEVTLLRVPQPYGNHNGGMLTFGLDGYLYIGLGDGGSAGDPHGNGQSLASLLGKVLRIDVDGASPYGIPVDNPFAQGGGLPEIWAYGLRNPWRFSFDRLTGDLFLGDVGQNQWEEINYLPLEYPAGANFGWNYFEGSYPYSGTPPSGVSMISPIAEYGHDQGCSVTGGVVYRGEQLLEWQGVYIFGDYCSGQVWGVIQVSDDNWISEPLFEGLGRISSFGEDEAGEVYLVDHQGRVLQLVKN